MYMKTPATYSNIQPYRKTHIQYWWAHTILKVNKEKAGKVFILNPLMQV